tara:strand:+ start:3687 stop:4241 length:555 start_codon:yes stop_codon:yes gene_type:complete
MARTSKSRGSIPFSMRSGNKPSPNKFLKGLGKKMVGGINKVFGGGAQQAVGIQPGEGGGMTGREAQMMANQRMMGKMNVSNLPPGGALYGGGPMPKKEGYTPYKTDAILVRGAYDAASGKGTAKYGQIAKARALGDMSRDVGETAGVLYGDSYRAGKKDIKKDMKLNKFEDRKSKGWKDNMRYS